MGGQICDCYVRSYGGKKELDLGAGIFSSIRRCPVPCLLQFWMQRRRASGAPMAAMTRLSSALAQPVAWPPCY